MCKTAANWLKVSEMPIAPFRTSLSCYLSISISISISTIRYTCNLATVEDIVPPSTFARSDSFSLSANMAQRTASPRAPNGPIREFYRTCWDAYLPHTQKLRPTLGTGGKIKGWTHDQPLCGIQIYTNTRLSVKLEHLHSRTHQITPPHPFHRDTIRIPQNQTLTWHENILFLHQFNRYLTKKAQEVSSLYNTTLCISRPVEVS